MDHRLNEATRHIPIPQRMRDLPVDERGYLVPWFVARTGDATWDFRAIRPRGVQRAMLGQTCWLCGGKLGVYRTFVSGPMCGINRISAEPPSHRECARYAVKACPFLVNPRMRRNEKNLPEDATDPGGIMLRRNPGAIMLWTTKDYAMTSANLIEMGDPKDVEWWCEGRKATREEVLRSVETGMPHLTALCPDQESKHALMLAVLRFKPYLPEGTAELEVAS